MRHVLYLTGRVFQLMGLITLPSSMWVAHFEKNERASIVIFVSAIILFLIGYGCGQFAKSKV